VKYSITQLLYAMVVMAFVAAIIGAGTNGSPLAYGIGVSLCTLAIYFTFFAILYWVANYFSFLRTQVNATSKIESVQESDS